MADVFLVEDLLNDSNKVDVVMNKAMGDSLLGKVTKDLREKGYHVDDSVVTSVGLTLNKHRVYKVARTEIDQDVSPKLLPFASSPFYVHEKFQQDSILKQSLTTVYKSLILASAETEFEHTVIQDASSLGQRLGVTTMFVLFLGGYNVSPSRQYTEEFSTDNRTEGNIGLEHISQLTVMFYIIDVESGELIWFDQAYAKGGTVHKEKILRLAGKVIDRLP